MASNRLSELVKGVSFSRFSDVESQSSRESVDAKLLTQFDKESEKIQRVLDWAERKLKDVAGNVQYGERDDSSVRAAERSVDEVEEKLRTVRGRLKRMANENATFKEKHKQANSATVRARMVQYGTIGDDFLDKAKQLAIVRSQLREAKQDALGARLRSINPDTTDADIKALVNDDASVDQVLGVVSSVSIARHQLTEIRERNRDIQRLNRSLVELHDLFQDMSTLITSQKKLIQDADYELSETTKITKKAKVELETAYEYQTSFRRKRRCIILTISIILLIVGIVVAVWIAMVIKRNKNSQEFVNALRN